MRAAHDISLPTVSVPSWSIASDSVHSLGLQGPRVVLVRSGGLPGSGRLLRLLCTHCHFQEEGVLLATASKVLRVFRQAGRPEMQPVKRKWPGHAWETSPSISHQNLLRRPICYKTTEGQTLGLEIQVVELLQDMKITPRLPEAQAAIGD